MTNLSEFIFLCENGLQPIVDLKTLPPAFIKFYTTFFVDFEPDFNSFYFSDETFIKSIKKPLIGEIPVSGWKVTFYNENR